MAEIYDSIFYKQRPKPIYILNSYFRTAVRASFKWIALVTIVGKHTFVSQNRTKQENSVHALFG